MKRYGRDVNIKGFIYFGTCVRHGGCVTQDLRNQMYATSHVNKKLLEKDDKDSPKYMAFSCELEFTRGLSSGENEHNTKRWESFFQYVGNGMKGAQSSTKFMQLEILNIRTERKHDMLFGLIVDALSNSF